MPSDAMTQNRYMNGTLTSSVVARLRADIINGVLPPGSKLRTRELCDRYEISLVPMREALSRLVSGGFVQVEDQRGFRVADVSADDLNDITNVRLHVEKEALRLSIEKGGLAWESNLVAAHHHLSRLPMEMPGAQGVNPEWEQAHTAFHQALLAACNSRLLLQLAEQLREQTSRYRHLSIRAAPPAQNNGWLKRDVAAEHEALLNAAVKKDIALANELLEKHFRNTSNLVLKLE